MSVSDATPAMLRRAAAHNHGGWGTTPLHEAIQRGNVELVRIVPAAGPDLTVEDRQFRSTPLGRARHFGHAEIAALIEERADAPGPG